MRAIIAAMEGMLQPPSATAFDAAASLLSMLVFLAVGVAAAARSRDARAHAFLAAAVASAIPYALTVLVWWRGSAVYTAPTIALTAVAFTIGSAALFHFTQVFPYRRPWIRSHFSWLAAAYLVLPLPVAFIAWEVGTLLAPVAAAGAGGIGAVSDSLAVAIVLLAMIPLLFVVGLMLPFAGVMSLFKSWQEAKKASDQPARVSTFWMLISQMAGGVLAVLVLPLLHFIGIGAAWALAIAALTYAFGLLMPLSFAVAVWRYGLLDHGARMANPKSQLPDSNF